MSGLGQKTGEDIEASVSLLEREVRRGRQSALPDVRLRIGHCVFDSPDAHLPVSLLPQLVHVRGESRLATLVRLAAHESRAWRPARDVILARPMEIILIEALRCTAESTASSGLVLGLADPRLSLALWRMQEHPTQPWAVTLLAKEAALSRSAFVARFGRAVGVPPMTYLLAWCLALAKNALRRQQSTIAEVAEHVRYRSASAFGIAFIRHVGVPPTQFAREQLGALGGL
jgi:AraC-like DNA-binding protein